MFNMPRKNILEHTEQAASINKTMAREGERGRQERERGDRYEVGDGEGETETERVRQTDRQTESYSGSR